MKLVFVMHYNILRTYPKYISDTLQTLPSFKFSLLFINCHERCNVYVFLVVLIICCLIFVCSMMLSGSQFSYIAPLILRAEN